MRTRLPIAMLAAAWMAASAHALPPVVTQWKLNRTNATGYGGIVADVTQVRHSSTNVYVSCNGVPSYSIGPWPGNPNTPTALNWVYKLPIVPQPNTGTPVAVGLGHVGVLRDGTGLYDPRDAMSYNNLGIWRRIAWYFEISSFDSCLGHPSPQREWHPHAKPVCLLGGDAATRHSALIGFAFDGYPIYGPYGYANADGTGGVARMETSYRKRNITARTTLPDGTVLQPSQYGPAIGGTYPLGCFVEDWELAQGLGHLDSHNGRFCVTPEYPAGTYCYFVTIDATGTPVYPYVLGPTYYGTVPAGNTGPTGGHNSPGAGEVVTAFTGSACECDLDGNRAVEGADLVMVLAAWGLQGGQGDIDRNGSIDGHDLAQLLSAWGPCP